MTRRKLPPLISGPYTPPPYEAGCILPCEVRGRVVVRGTSDAPVPWPYHLHASSRPSLVVCGDLVRAVRTESVAAVAAHWGITPRTVYGWRVALGVGRMNAGTLDAWRKMAPRKLPRAARVRGGKTAGAMRRGTQEP